MVLLFQCVLACLLFSLAVAVLVLKNDPVSALYNYPPKIQARVKSLPQYVGHIPTRNDKWSAKLLASVGFVVVGVILCKWAGTVGFWGAFTHMFILFTLVNIYDIVVIDWLLFSNLKVFRIPGTEDMVSEYHNYGFHVLASLRGTIIGLVISLVVGLVCMFL